MCLTKSESFNNILENGSGSKVSACNAGDLGSIPGLGRSPGEGNSNPFQYSCLENPMDGGAWYATDHGITELDTTEQLHFLSFFLSFNPWIFLPNCSSKDQQNSLSSHYWSTKKKKKMLLHSLKIHELSIPETC